MLWIYLDSKYYINFYVQDYYQKYNEDTGLKSLLP